MRNYLWCSFEVADGAMHLILTHYYHRGDNPFQSLSSLAEEEALHIIANLQGRNGAVYRRFSDPKKYLRQRKETESWIRNEFIKKGGQPISTYPQYFVVEQSVWIEEGYNGQSCIVQFPLSAFSPKHVSFTYPDSMLSYWLKGQTNKVFHHPEYHGQVFASSEMDKIIDKFGIPREEWRTEEARRYDLFIEAQVWVNLP
jgi:hypothetical protein